MATTPPDEDAELMRVAEELAAELGMPVAKMASILRRLIAAQQVWGEQLEPPEDKREP